MAVTGYADEAAIANYMHDVLGADELATSLGWSVAAGDYQDAVDETLLVLDITDPSTLTATADLRKLRAIARAEVWRSVMSRTAGDYDVRLEDDTDTKRSQVHKHARAMFEAAKAEAVALGADDYDPQQKPAVVTTTIARRGMDVS